MYEGGLTKVQKNSPGCRPGFTTVSGYVRYDGNTAKLDRHNGNVNCLPDSHGPVNKKTWCGTVNDGAGGRDHYMSLGVNGEFDASGSKNSGVTVGGEVNRGDPESGSGGGLNGQFSQGSSRGFNTQASYWLRIDVRPDGTHALRGGRNA